jgi:hypothetical protein
MRLPQLFLLLICFRLCAQQFPESLKKNLFEAEKKYGVTFTFNEGLISEYLSHEEPLPDTLEEFQNLLKNEYNLQGSTTDTSVILFSNRVFSTLICGYVKSDLFDQVLENTVVVFGNRYTVSDDLGFFSFENANPKFNKIFFKSINFGIKEHTVNQSEKCSEYYINSTEIELGEVIVNYIAPPIQKGGSGSYEIDLNNFRLSPGSINPDVFELLRLIPGISSLNEDNQLFIRGGTPDQNQIIWNNIRLYQNNHANGGLSSLNPYSIDNVKLFVKGVPSSFGEHTSGLILLDSYKSPNTHLVNGSLGVGLLDADFVSNLNLKDKVQVQLSARSAFNTTLSDNFRINTFNNIQNNTTVSQVFSQQRIYYNDFSFSSRIRLKKNSVLDLHSFYMEDEIGYDLTQTNTEYNDLLNTKSMGFGSRLRIDKNNWRNSFNISYSDYQLLYDRNLLQYEKTEENEISLDLEFEDFTERNNHIEEAGIKTQHAKTLNQKYAVSFGTDLIYRNVDFSNQNSINDEEVSLSNSLSGFSLALYGTTKTSFAKNNSLELGLRYNYFESLGIFRLEPRLNITQKLSKQWLINTSYEKKSQTIYRTNETIQNNTSRSNNLWTLAGDEQYPLLKSTQYSLGMTRKGGGTIVDVDFYSRTLDGISTFNFGYLDPNDSDFHLGESKILGLDFFFQKSWNNLNFWTNYSFQDNQNKFDELKSGVWFNSNFLVKHSVATGINYRYRNWSLDANYTLRSGVPYSKPIGAQLVNQSYVLQYNTLNSEFLPSYERLDLSLSKRYLLKGNLKLDFKVALKNLTNKRNVLERLFLYDKTIMAIKEVDRYSMSPFLNFGVRFYY